MLEPMLIDCHTVARRLQRGCDDMHIGAEKRSCGSRAATNCAKFLGQMQGQNRVQISNRSEAVHQLPIFVLPAVKLFEVGEERANLWRKHHLQVCAFVCACVHRNLVSTRARVCQMIPR
jgi:hypothetical protein